MGRIVVGLMAALFLGACATTPTPEQDALAAVEEIRVALAGDDADAVWDLLSTRHRNLYEEARQVRAGLVDPPGAYAVVPREVLDMGDAVSPGDARRMSARDLHRALYVASERPRVGAGARIRTSEEWTQVNDDENGYRWWLRPEEGRWKLAVLVPPEFPAGAEPMVHESPSGREIVLAVWAELSRKKVHEVPLPVVPGDAELGYPALEVRLTVERDGRVEMKGEFLDDDTLRERLLVFAERQRDMEHPVMPSVVTVWLAVHRELAWRRVDEVLWILADADVRIRKTAFLTSEYPEDHRGVPVFLRARDRPNQIRYPEPRMEVRIGGDVTTAAGRVGLEKALAARPEGDFEKGIRVFVSPDLPVSDALSALLVVGRRGEVIHVLTEEPFAGLTLDGKSVAPVEGVEPSPEPRTLDLTVELWLPPEQRRKD